MLVDSLQNPALNAFLVYDLEGGLCIRILAVDRDEEVVSKSPIERPSVLAVTEVGQDSLYLGGLYLICCYFKVQTSKAASVDLDYILLQSFVGLIQMIRYQLFHPGIFKTSSF